MIFLCLSVMITVKISSLATKNAHIHDMVVNHSLPQLYSNSVILHPGFLSLPFMGSQSCCPDLDKGTWATYLKL